MTAGFIGSCLRCWLYAQLLAVRGTVYSWPSCTEGTCVRASGTTKPCLYSHKGSQQQGMSSQPSLGVCVCEAALRTNVTRDCTGGSLFIRARLIQNSGSSEGESQI